VADARARLTADDLMARARADLAARVHARAARQVSGWRTVARPEQIHPAGDWRVWCYVGGRGTGKTRAGSEWVHERRRAGSGRIALVAATAADARDVMVEGESGLRARSPAHDRPRYNPSLRRVTWADGSIATMYSADEPDRLRGPQHTDAWADECASWRYPEAWDMLLMGLRLGADPRVVVTTTPRPTRWLRDLMAAPGTTTTRGTTYANAANLAPAFLAAILSRYEGTTLGRQELHAELIDDVVGALWTREAIDAARVRLCPQLARVVVAVDPAASSGDDSDLTGIITLGMTASVRPATQTSVIQGIAALAGHPVPLPPEVYVFADDTLRATPEQWGRAVVRAYDGGRADLVVAESNQGGEMVATVVRGAAAAMHREGLRPHAEVAVRLVTASRDKATRAGPVSALYEQGRVHHVGALAKLEDEMATWVPGVSRKSPDRVDALVHGVTALVLSRPTADPAAITRALERGAATPPPSAFTRRM
jgi:phage terminase large subunit-like protein